MVNCFNVVYTKTYSMYVTQVCNKIYKNKQKLTHVLSECGLVTQKDAPLSVVTSVRCSVTKSPLSTPESSPPMFAHDYFLANTYHFYLSRYKVLCTWSHLFLLCVFTSAIWLWMGIPSRTSCIWRISEVRS